MSAVMTETRRNGVPAEVHALLTLWGNWTRRMRMGPSGYPAESPFVKAALFGKLGLPQQSNVRQDQDSMPSLVEWMDKIVEALPPDLHEIIIAKYRPKVDLAGNEMRPEQMARSLGMSVSTFRNRLEGAQWYVFAKMYP
jgi:hypothetical protein